MKYKLNLFGFSSFLFLVLKSDAVFVTVVVVPLSVVVISIAAAVCCFCFFAGFKSDEDNLDIGTIYKLKINVNISSFRK